MGDFNKEDATRMITVVGRAGIGKTAMVCKLLKSLENGALPDDGGPCPWTASSTLAKPDPGR